MHFTSAISPADRRSITPSSTRARIAAWGSAALQATVRAVAAIGSDEIRVWSREAHPGERIWYGYDPRTGDRCCSPSEDELRAWLEARHRYRF